MWLMPAPSSYLSAMQFRSRLPAYRLLMALAMTAALLLPEAGHSFAHHHAAEHSTMRVAEHHHGVRADVGADEAVLENHRHSDHPHLDLLAGPPSKPPLVCAALVIRVAALLLPDLDDSPPLTPPEATGLSPGDLTHGPPSPSRAPPQV
jgi:hypothetical protein